MRKKSVLWFVLCWMLSVCITAQELSVKSFRVVQNDLSASTSSRRDYNGTPCALIKVQLPIQNAQFEPNVIGEVAYKVNEYWVYLPKGTKHLKVKHPNFLTKDVVFAESGISSLESKTTYELVLALPEGMVTNLPKAITQQYVLFQVSPPNAIVEFDGDVLEVTDGVATKRKAFGTYTYSVQAPLHHTQTGSVTVNDPQNKHRVEVELQPAYGFIEVPGDGNLRGAKVFINNEYKGTAPYLSDRMASGSYSVRVVQNFYAPLQQEVTVADNQTTRFAPSLSADYATLTLLVENDAEIWVNDERKGRGRWVGPLASGDYRVECRKEHHRTSVRELSVSPVMEGQSIQLHAPTPIYGSLDISSTPANADIYIDNEKVGTTPMLIPQYLIGDHTLRISKANHADYTRQFRLSEGESLEFQATLSSGREVSVTVREGATIYIDDHAAGTTTFKGMLSYGKHTLTIRNNGEEIHHTIIDIPMQGIGSLPFNINIGNGFTESIRGVHFKMILVKGGTYKMGDDESQYDDEKPAHQVSLRDYYIGETEVTEALWKAVMGQLPSGKGLGDNYPVTNVSWRDCQQFIRRLNQLTGRNYSLPTEAQWEFAARGGIVSRGTKYSGNLDINEVAWYHDNSNGKRHPVATKKPNELMIYDMSGNVVEWCQDGWGKYSYGKQHNPTDRNNHVARGGGYLHPTHMSSVSARMSFVEAKEWLGFRLALKKEP